MKQHTLAPAVLASLTAAGLVLTPVTAFAQDEGDASTLTVEQTTAPTDEPTAHKKSEASEKSQKSSGEDDGGQDSPPQPTSDPSPTATQTQPAEPTPVPSETPTEEPTPEATKTEEPEADQQDVTVHAGDAPLSDVAYVTGEDAPAGASISVSGLQDDQEYTLEVAGGPEDSDTYSLDVQDGAAQQSYTIEVPEGTDVSALVGSRTVTVENSAGESVATGSFEITDDTEDDAPEFDPELHVPGSIEVDDVMVPEGEEPGDRGLQIRASGLEPDTSYTFRVVPPAENPDLEAEFTAHSDENGDASGSYFIEWSGDYLADALAGTYRVELLDGDDEVLDQADVEFVVGDADDDDDDQGEGGEDDGQDDDGQDDDGQDDGGQDQDDQDDQDDDSQDEAADPSVTVDPKELSAAAFIDYDRGVQVTARDCTPGQTVDLEVFWPGTDDVAYADGLEADEDGTAGFSFYGTGDRASDYVGTWKVRISCGGETVGDTFTVTGQAGDDGRGGDELPRTGTEAGVLGIVAAGLMTVGAATVMISSRPRRRTDV
ncbi:hypothetical protein [Brevibacterium senegalense]|uniref:hypothetical protein n=1 Tax=Brevibacterium senegalense TaxID=1033736 RepID=UPI00030E5C17|nr:hypothetical protein [Brevibacterium senegalense]